MSRALEMIAEERARQLAKGYDAPHDDLHRDKEIAQGAMCYLAAYLQGVDPREQTHDLWPWPDSSPNFEGQISDLVKAGAMIEAELERLIREKHQ